LRHGEAGYCLWQEGGVGVSVAAALNWDREAVLAFEQRLLPVFGHHGKPIANFGGTAAFRQVPEKVLPQAVLKYPDNLRHLDSF
jgi:hypothetical protein